MNMLEELMGSVAHEVRNPLAVVRGNLQILLWKEDLVSLHPGFHVMMEKLDSAMELLTEFLQTLKPQLNAPAKTDINAVILSVKRLLEAEAIRHGHVISFELGGKTPPLLISPSKLIHLLYNMCFIAFRYMSVSGDIVVSTNTCDGGAVICSVTSAARGCRPDSKEQDFCPEGMDQMAGVCRKIAGEFNARFEIYPYASQGAEVVLTVDSTIESGQQSRQADC
jgi:signal transduction histidine kinase